MSVRVSDPPAPTPQHRHGATVPDPEGLRPRQRRRRVLRSRASHTLRHSRERGNPYTHRQARGGVSRAPACTVMTSHSGLSTSASTAVVVIVVAAAIMIVVMVIAAAVPLHSTLTIGTALWVERSLHCAHLGAEA